MSTAPGNIFFNKETLAFSMPLILICGGYAFFKYVPLKYGVPILAVLIALLLIRSQFVSQHNKKLQNMDKKTMEDIAREFDDEDMNDDSDDKAKKLQKKKAAIQHRLAAEKRKEEKQAKRSSNRKKGKGGDDDDDDDVAALATFAKGKKKKS